MGLGKFAVWTALAAVAATAASAQGIMRREPAAGQLRAGDIVFVDDGTCPKGQIKKVTGGSNVGNNVAGMVGRNRHKECIKRPPAS
jgi:hypothetical protein